MSNQDNADFYAHFSSQILTFTWFDYHDHKKVNTII